MLVILLSPLKKNVVVKILTITINLLKVRSEKRFPLILAILQIVNDLLRMVCNCVFSQNPKKSVAIMRTRKQTQWRLS